MAASLRQRIEDDRGVQVLHGGPGLGRRPPPELVAWEGPCGGVVRVMCPSVVRPTTQVCECLLPVGGFEPVVFLWARVGEPGIFRGEGFPPPALVEPSRTLALPPSAVFVCWIALFCCRSASILASTSVVFIILPVFTPPPADQLCLHRPV